MREARRGREEILSSKGILLLLLLLLLPPPLLLPLLVVLSFLGAKDIPPFRFYAREERKRGREKRRGE